ncbi:MAG: class I SAM-dependent methyltransferase [Desulfuromonadaceae bacterium]|nr:class I SAM-dependent methyltransferase [Desulfuromonadaceae bacterium]MDD2855526.1 class I SAM-dependent methyltransferase [Desulfuromonadaceae bacterium]
MNWDERYSEPGFTYGTAPNEFLLSVVDKIPRGNVLSLAEGEGRNSVYLASLGFEVTGVDSSAVGLRKAGELAAAAGVKVATIQRDLNEFVIEPESWSVIIGFYCHLPSELRSKLFQAAVKGLVPGGIFILEAFRKEQLKYGTGGPQSIDMLMSLDDLKRELFGLEFIHAVEIDRDVREGSKHTGLAAVVQIFGRKIL